MKKKFFTSNIILLILSITVLLSNVTVLAVDNTREENNTYIVESFDKANQDLSYTEGLMKVCKEKMDYAHQVAEYARKLNYGEDSVIIETVREDWWKYYDYYNRYSVKADSIKAAIINKEEELKLEEQRSKRNEYPIAYDVWMLLKNAGYNDYVCAGIIGNMMVECGGNTLNLNPKAYSPSRYYYGLCQWNKSNYGSIFGKDLGSQINFLLSNIEEEFNSFGSCYKSGFKYKSFLSLQNEREAAKAFAKCYERCGSSSYSTRQTCATIAYEYFLN